MKCVISFNRNLWGPLWGAVRERYSDYAEWNHTVGCKVTISLVALWLHFARANLRSMPRTEMPGERSAFCQRLLCVNRAPRACCHRQTHPFPEDRARCREPAPSVNERSFPARPGTGSTETTQGMGRVAAKMYTVTGTSMTAELLRPTTVIHHIPTHAARTRAYLALILLNAATSG